MSGELTQSAGALADTDRAVRIRDQLGPCVLLSIPLGEKGPLTQAWQKLTLADMTPAYLASLDHGQNIGVSLGAVSEGLCTIDVDDDDLLEAFLDLNPYFRESLISRGARGGNVWVRIEGECPPSAKLKLAGKPWGEWRADGNQTVIDGQHPSGCWYRDNGKRPLPIKVSRLMWPTGMPLPWEKHGPGETEAPPPVRDIDAELTAKCGPAYYVTKKGGVGINENYFVQRICRENLVLFEQDEGRFYRYSANTGAWEAVVSEIIKELVRVEWERLTRIFNEPGLAFKVGDHQLTALVSGIKAHSGRSKVFKRLKNIIHCANGMLKISSEGDWELMPFSPAYFARNPIPILWDPDATCPKFDALLEFALPPDDASLFWRWFGSVLLTGNAAQRILLCVGKAHTAKSTIAEVVELVRGLTNVTALRTKLLGERFEIARLFGYTLLTAKDTPGRFLEEDGAQSLKKLVGHDYTPGERKGSMESVPIYGDYDCLITCNERLLVKLEGETDVGAWRRRLMVLRFTNVVAEEDRIENYAQTLFAEEGPGILRKAVEGAIIHLGELKDGGNFKESAEQKERVDHLLSESESVRYFVAERVCRVRGGAGLSTEELVSAYIDYCDERGWRPFGIKQVERALPDIMMAIQGVHVGANIVRDGKRARGYPHVALAQSDDLGEDGKHTRTNGEETQGEF